VRGIGLLPMTAPSEELGCIAFMNAAFGLRLEALFFLAGAFLLAFFFAAIRCLPLSSGGRLGGGALPLASSTVTRGCRGKTLLSMIVEG
jgi:hypothetical protein